MILTCRTNKAQINVFMRLSGYHVWKPIISDLNKVSANLIVGKCHYCWVESNKGIKIDLILYRSVSCEIILSKILCKDCRSDRDVLCHFNTFIARSALVFYMVFDILTYCCSECEIIQFSRWPCASDVEHKGRIWAPVLADQSKRSSRLSHVEESICSAFD